LFPVYVHIRFEQTGQAKYKTAADTFRRQLNGQPRTAQGQFWHKLMYFNQGARLAVCEASFD
jgi:unsaturated rhamnogalacturonyl hydrolase